MSQTTSDFLVERLHQWGVRRIYGYPGDGINGVLGALERFKKIEFTQARHEEMAAFMACAHAKFTGEVGVCLATSGPGAIHLLNGLYDAKKDHMPVLAIVGQQPATCLGSDYQQEVDIVALYKDVANHYAQLISVPAQVRHVVDQAFRIAKAEREITCIVIPNDVQEEKAVPSPPRHHGVAYSSCGYSAPEIVPSNEDLDRVAAVLNEGKKVAMLVGAGALGASDEVEVVAETLSAGVAKALLGKAVLPDDLPFVTGAIGLLGTKPSWDLMQDCDTLLMVGTSFPYSEFLPKDGKVRAVQIDLKPRSLGLRYPLEVALHGDAKLTLGRILPKLHPKEHGAWRRGIVEGVKKWWELLEDRAGVEADPINPQLLFWKLSPLLPDRCILTCDSGSAAFWFARDLKVRRGMMASLSGGLATMCPGVPYAIAAKFAHPDRVSIALVGDGAMQMLGINGLVTISKYWREWSNPQLIVLVLNNRDLNMVTWEQRVLSGDPKFDASQNLPDFDYAQYAEMLGLRGIMLDRPEKIDAAYADAFASDRPVVIDARCDPEVPPLPPHISMEQAKNFMASMTQDDKGGHAVMQALKDMMAGWLPGSKA